ncbi:MAG: SDR family oxidoreductase [Polyangiaceae bacterium]
MQLKGKAAVVTGGGRGIGRAVALELARRGANVVVAARSSDEIESVAAAVEKLGCKSAAVRCDVTSPDSVEALARAAHEAVGSIDILVNNAGIASSAPIKHQSLEEWNRVMAVNATGPFLCARAFLGEMVERGFGRIVNVASITSRMGAPYIAAYTASKHALLGFTRVAAAEYADKGITVNAVCPGYVDTDMTTGSVQRVVGKTGLPDDQALAAILETANQKRLITPEEVAFWVATLCDEQAGGVNGQAIVIDGGGLLA